MKTTLSAILTISMLSMPLAAFAQSSNGSVTRAQVRSELVQLEKVGYRPGEDGPHYPDALLSAEARVNGGSHVRPIGSSYGSSNSGSSASGVGSNYDAFPLHSGN